MTVYMVLSGEHSEIRTLLNALEAAPDAMGGGKESMFDMLRRELLSHARAEQATVYMRAAERIPMTEVEEARQEHTEIEQALISMETSDFRSEEWKNQLKALKQMVLHHVEEEENEMFPKMKEAFSDEEAKQMAKEFHEAKNKEMEALDG